MSDRLPGSLDERDTAGEVMPVSFDPKRDMSPPGRGEVNSAADPPVTPESPPVREGTTGAASSSSPLGPEATDMAADGTSDWPSEPNGTPRLYDWMEDRWTSAFRPLWLRWMRHSGFRRCLSVMLRGWLVARSNSSRSIRESLRPIYTRSGLAEPRSIPTATSCVSSHTASARADQAERTRTVRQSQNRYLYDQWDIRIAHCGSAKHHDWHGWVANNNDLRCPGTPVRLTEAVADAVARAAELAAALRAVIRFPMGYAEGCTFESAQAAARSVLARDGDAT